MMVAKLEGNVKDKSNNVVNKLTLQTNEIHNENDVLFQKVTQAYSEKNPSAPIRSRIYYHIYFEIHNIYHFENFML